MINQQWIEELKTTDKEQCFAGYYFNDSYCAVGLGLDLYFRLQGLDKKERVKLLCSNSRIDAKKRLEGLKWLGVEEDDDGVVFNVADEVLRLNDTEHFSFREIAEILEDLNRGLSDD